MENSETNKKPITKPQVLAAFLCLFGVSLFFSQSGISIALALSLLILLDLKYRAKAEWAGGAPRYMLIAALGYATSLLVSVAVSTNHSSALKELSAVAYLLLAGMLYAAPLTLGQRRAALLAYFLAAAIAGVHGSLQYFSLYFEPFAGRGHGMMHPVHYGGLMAVALMAALILLVVPNSLIGRGGPRRALVSASLLIAAGLVFSQTRGAWLAFGVGGAVVLFLYRKRLALVFVGVLVALGCVLLAVSPHMRWRLVTMYDGVVKGEARSETTGDRPVIWKGAMKLFAASPIVGTGTGDFTAEFKDMMAKGELPTISAGGTLHAHSIYMHALATQGVVGIAALLGLLSAAGLWGYGLSRKGQPVGYMLVFLTLFIALWGITETHLIVSRIFGTYCFVVGVLGGNIKAEGQ